MQFNICYCFRQDHLVHGLRVQPGPADGVRVGRAGAGLRGPRLAAEVRRRHQEEHRALQPPPPLRLPRAAQGPLRLRQGDRRLQQMEEAVQRGAV